MQIGIVLLAAALAKHLAYSKPEGKSDGADFIYYKLHGYWPSWYTGYHLIGKRSAEPEPESKYNNDYLSAYLSTLYRLQANHAVILASYNI